MQKAEGVRPRLRQGAPIGKRNVQHDEGPYYVRFNEGGRAVDRTIHVAFGGQVKHDVWLKIREDRRHRSAVADVRLPERVAPVCFD